MSRLDNINAWTGLRQYELQLIKVTGEDRFMMQPSLGSRTAQ